MIQNTREDRSKKKKRREQLDQKQTEATLNAVGGLMNAMSNFEIPEEFDVRMNQIGAIDKGLKGGSSSESPLPSGSSRSGYVNINKPINEDNIGTVEGLMGEMGYEVDQSNPEVDEDITTWTTPQPQSFFQRINTAGEKPTYDTEKSDRLKKLALANGLSQALGAIHRIGLQNNRGIAGQDSGQVGQFLMNEIDFLDDQYLKDLSDYKTNLQKDAYYNTELANKEAVMGYEDQVRLQQLEEARRELAKKQNWNSQEKEADRLLQWQIANLRKQTADKDREFDNRRLTFLTGKEDRDDLRTQLTGLNRNIATLYNRLAVAVDDKEIASLNELIKQRTNEISAVNEALGKLTGATYTPPPLEGRGSFQPGLLDAAIQQRQGIQRPPVSPGSTQIDTAVSEKPIQKPSEEVKPLTEKQQEAKSFFDSAVSDAIKSGKIHRSQMPILQKAARDAEVELTEEDIKELLEDNNVKISYGPREEVIDQFAYPLGKPNKSQLSQR